MNTTRHLIGRDNIWPSRVLLYSKPIFACISFHDNQSRNNRVYMCYVGKLFDFKEFCLLCHIAQVFVRNYDFLLWYDFVHFEHRKEDY